MAPDVNIAEVIEHREARDRRLRSKDGWLALVERVILDEGDNAVDGGTATLRDGDVTLRIAGETFTWKKSQPSAGRYFFRGERRYEILRQATKVGVRVRDPSSEVLQRFGGLEFYDVDIARYRVKARVLGPPRTLTLQVGLGVDVDHDVPGTLTFSIDGRELTMDAVIDEDAADRLFLIFKDATNGKGTYGAGRFLYAPLPDANGDVVVDFNKCFNPPCALTDFASCPIVPPQNRFPIAIEAGEKYPALSSSSSSE